MKNQETITKTIIIETTNHPLDNRFEHKYVVETKK